MTWRNPSAWLGLLALAIPIAVHLLGRRRPVPLRFPSLQFLGVSQAQPKRRHRLNDVPLMFVRLAIVLAAVAAVADPVLVGSASDGGNAIARAIVVDTSASMDRPTPAGRPARDEATSRAQAHTAGATTFRIIEGAQPRSAITRAVTWAAEQPGRREIVVVSDFQKGAIDPADLADIPAHVGLTFEPIETSGLQDVAGPTILTPAGSLTSRLHLTDSATGVEWIRAAPGTEIASPLVVLSAADEQRDVEAALEAASIEGLPSPSSYRDIAVVFPRSADRQKLRTDAHGVDEPWMFDAVKTIREDPILTTLPCQNTSCPATTSGAGTVAGKSRLLVFVEASPRELYGAAVLRAAWRAAAGSASLAELEPGHVDDATLKTWGRPASESPGAGQRVDGRPVARWFWVLALVLLAFETWMRRPLRSGEIEVTHARVA